MTGEQEISALKDRPPAHGAIADYDRIHSATYLRLLDAHDAGATWRDAVGAIFKLDPDSDPARLEQMHRSHLERAEWLRASGYRLLLNTNG